MAELDKLIAERMRAALESAEVRQRSGLNAEDVPDEPTLAAVMNFVRLTGIDASLLMTDLPKAPPSHRSTRGARDCRPARR